MSKLYCQFICDFCDKDVRMGLHKESHFTCMDCLPKIFGAENNPAILLKSYECHYCNQLAHPAVYTSNTKDDTFDSVVCLTCLWDHEYCDGHMARLHRSYFITDRVPLDSIEKCKRGCGFFGSQYAMLVHNKGFCAKEKLNVCYNCAFPKKNVTCDHCYVNPEDVYEYLENTTNYLKDSKEANEKKALEVIREFAYKPGRILAKRVAKSTV